MINLRYHIVSITAVFLALAIGVVMGTSFLGKATIDQLKTQIRSAERGIRSTKSDNARLSRDLKRINDRDQLLNRQGSEVLFRNQLSGVPILIIAAAGVDQSSLDTLRNALASSSADFRGTLVITDKLKLEGDGVAKMSQLLGMTTTDRRQVRRVLATRMAEVLRAGSEATPSAGSSGTGASSTTTTPGATTTTTTRPRQSTGVPTSAPALDPTSPEQPQPELLTALREQGWVAYQPPDGGSGDDPLLTTGGYRYVMVSGPEPAVPDSEFLLPVLQAMADAGPTPVVVASAAVGSNAEQTRTAVVGPVRSDDRLNKNVSTVDDLEQFAGLAAVVLAISNLDDNVHGHYGYDDGATPLPPAP